MINLGIWTWPPSAKSQRTRDQHQITKSTKKGGQSTIIRNNITLIKGRKRKETTLRTT